MTPPRPIPLGLIGAGRRRSGSGQGGVSREADFDDAARRGSGDRCRARRRARQSRVSPSLDRLRTDTHSRLRRPGAARPQRLPCRDPRPVERLHARVLAGRSAGLHADQQSGAAFVITETPTDPAPRVNKSPKFHHRSRPLRTREERFSGARQLRPAATVVRHPWPPCPARGSGRGRSGPRVPRC